MVDARELGLAERGRQRHMALDRELCSFRVERLAVVEFHVGPELDRHLLAVGRRLMRQRELRHDVELLVDVEQLVAEGREHDAADIGAADAGIEDVRILGNADAKRGLGLGLGRACERRQQCRRQECQTHRTHRSQPLFCGYAGFVPNELTPLPRTASGPPLKAATNFSRTGEKPPSVGTIASDDGSSDVRWHAVACPMPSRTS